MKKRKGLKATVRYVPAIRHHRRKWEQRALAHMGDRHLTDVRRNPPTPGSELSARKTQLNKSALPQSLFIQGRPDGQKKPLAERLRDSSEESLSFNSSFRPACTPVNNAVLQSLFQYLGVLQPLSPPSSIRDNSFPRRGGSKSISEQRFLSGPNRRAYGHLC